MLVVGCALKVRPGVNLIVRPGVKPYSARYTLNAIRNCGTPQAKCSNIYGSAFMVRYTVRYTVRSTVRYTVR